MFIVFMFSYTLSQITLKNSIGKVVFQILVTWLFSRTKIPPILKRNIFLMFFEFHPVFCL